MPGIQLQFADEKDYMTFLETVLQQGPKLLSEEGFLKVLESISMIGRYHGIVVKSEKVYNYESPKAVRKGT